MSFRHSIITRFAAVCLILVLVTAGCLVWFAHRGTISALRTVERRSLDNILHLVEQELAMSQTLQEQYREQTVLSIKDSLRRHAFQAAARSDPLAYCAAGSSPDFSSAPGSPNVADSPNATDSPSTASSIDTLPACHAFFSAPQGGFTDQSGAALPPDLASQLAAIAPGGNYGALTLPEQPRRMAFFLPVAGGVLASTLPATALEDAFARHGHSLRLALQNLMADIHIQQSGYAAVFDGSGALVAFSGETPPQLPQELLIAALDQDLLTSSRRVMILPGENGDILYRLGYFRPLDWHVALAAPLDEMEAPAVRLVSEQLLITLLVAAFGTVIGLLLARYVALPVRRLSTAARQLPDRDILELDVGALFTSLPVDRKGEVGELAASLEFMTSALQKNVRELLSATALTQRLEGELAVARDIQFGILPKELPAREGLDLYAYMSTAKEVGGDLYDYFWLDEKRLCLVIGDVSDKGIPAALFMSMAVTLVRVSMREHRLTPEQALAGVNDTLARENPRNMFVTLSIGVLDLESHTLSWASGGHMPPILVRDGHPAPLQGAGDVIVGIFEDMPFTPLRAELRPGDTLLFYTDGISEAMNARQELFGETRILEFMAKSHTGARELTDGLLAAVKAHADGAEQSDDITILTVRLF